jgi:hypothetical protein
VYRLHGIFGSQNTTSTAGGFSIETAGFNPKHVVLERARGVRQHCAQGDSDSIGCRIIIDGAVEDERSVKTVNAYTFCLDKSG